MPFNDREKSFETKFSMDQETQFKVEARTSKLLGLWAAEKLGFTGDTADNYAKEVIASNLDEPGYNDVKRKIMGDFSARGLAINDAELESALGKAHATATEQILGAK